MARTEWKLSHISPETDMNTADMSANNELRDQETFGSVFLPEWLSVLFLLCKYPRALNFFFFTSGLIIQRKLSTSLLEQNSICSPGFEFFLCKPKLISF